jgi:hypothetical protein
MTRRSGPSAGDLAEEIVRRALEGRADLPYVVCLSEPPTPEEQLLLAACRLMRRPIAVMQTKCESVEEWVERHGPIGVSSKPLWLASFSFSG